MSERGCKQMLWYPCRIRLVFAYTGIVTCRVCIVSFMDPAGITHAVEVPASSLYEAAARPLQNSAGVDLPKWR